MRLPRINFLTTRGFALVALLCGGWPVLNWYTLRLNDGSDEPWGLAALGAALLFTPWLAWTEPLPRARLKWICALLAVYAATFIWAPPLVRALLLVTMIGFTAPNNKEVGAVAKSGVPKCERSVPTTGCAPSSPVANHQRFPAAWWGLLVLSLPVVATLQFYLGYPLRLLTTQLCVPLIALAGHTATAAGTTLHWAGERVIVDAPCSGIRMLWTGLFLAAVLACWHRLDARKTFALVRVASGVIFVANVIRAFVIFMIETDLWRAPEGSHEVAGLVCFAAAAGLQLWFAERLAKGGTGSVRSSEKTQLTISDLSHTPVVSTSTPSIAFPSSIRTTRRSSLP